MLSRPLVLFIGATLSLCLASGSSLARPIGPGDKCTGPALIRPEGGLYGTIYFSDQANALGRYPRRGYLPSNMVVMIDDPPATQRANFIRRYCHFNYRDVISGYLERKNLIALTEIAKSVGLDAHEIYGFVGPTNPAPDKHMRLYRTDKLSNDEVIADLGRNSVAVVFLLKGSPTADADALKVAYVADPDHATITPAYINASKNRGLINDDGSMNFEGAYRIYRPRAAHPAASNSAVMKPARLYEYLHDILNAPLDKIKGAIESAKDKVEKVAGLKECRKKVSIGLEFALKSGLGASLLSVSASGKEAVVWTKPAGQVEQFATIGSPNDISITAHGIAGCSFDAPAHLDQAHIVVAGPDNSNKGGFTLDRNEFFSTIEGGPIPNSLKSRSSLVNLKRPISQLFVVPRVNGERSPFYYTLFDRIERYMDLNVYPFGTVDLSSDDRFALTLLVAQSFSYWQ